MANKQEKVKRTPGEKLTCNKCGEAITDDLWQGVEVEQDVWVAVHLEDCNGEEAERLAENYSPDNL